MANAPTTALGRINSTASTPLALGTNYDTKYGTYLKLFSGELFKGFQPVSYTHLTLPTSDLV